jgi:alpha-galactosidase
MKIVDARFDRGFYCHAPSKVVVRLPAPGTTFTAMVGVDSNRQTRPGRGSVVFSVKIDDQLVFRSEVLREGTAAVPVVIDLDGAMGLVLQVEDAADGISHDQADWGNPKVELANGEVLSLDNLPMVGLQRGPHTTDPPFSFTYGNQSSAQQLEQWEFERAARKLDDQRTERTLTYTDPKSGLAVRCVAVEYHDFPTVEWTLYLENRGTEATPILKDIQALDIRLHRGPAGEFALHHQRGDSCTPDSYEPLTTALKPGVEERFAPVGGRPTNGAWPYYNVQWGSEGIIAVIGWPGQWAASFTRDAGNGLHVRGGQERTHFKLLPGEEVRTPLVVLQFYRGSRDRAQNVWRRWMLAHNLPRPGGELPPPMFTSCSGGFFPGLKCNQIDELRFIDTLVKEGVKLDYWWMDAGWYPCDAWPTVGDWHVDRTRFPQGLRAISDHAHAQGIKLILWFEPERVAPGTWLYGNHPEWMLGQDGAQKLLNLGNQEARDWLTDHVDKLITDEGVDLYRQDFNIDPLAYWRSSDPPDRQGLAEIRHVEGYLAFWDELRRRHPGMLIDSCASGGRRNDLETMRRAVPLLRSDYQSFQGDPSYATGNQGQLYGLSSWLPYFGTGVYYNDDQFFYNMRSHMGPAFALCADVRRKDVDWTKFRRVADQWREVAPYYLGDFHPLTPYSLAEDVWIAWQFDRPDLGEGMVQIFRRQESIYESARLRLHGLQPGAKYTLTNLDAPVAVEMTGKQLVDEGLHVTVTDRPGAVIITYRRAK